LKTLEESGQKSVPYDSMHLHLICPTVKTAALYLVSIKSYTKNTIRNTFVVGRKEQNKFKMK
jgi:hypothetical protein